MQYSVKIGDGVHWIGANDRRKELFENMWPLPNGVSYNSYLIVGDRTALIDTMESGADGSYLNRVEALLESKSLDYLVINHMELDHSGEIAAIVRRWPEVKVVGNAKTFKVLSAYFGGLEMSLQEVGEGDTLDLGSHKLTFAMTPMVHWPETMMTYESTQQILFSGDAFGTFGTVDGNVLDNNGLRFEYYEDEMRRYYSNIVGRYGTFVQKALAKLADVPVKTICSLHGPVWQKNAERVIALYDKWSRCDADEAVVVIYASMYGNTARTADYIANRIASEGVGDVRVYDVSKTHISHLISEIWRCQTIVLGSCAYNAQMFPMMEFLTLEMEHYGLKNRKLALFGGYSWSGGGVRNLRAFAERIGWEMVAEPVEIMGAPDASKYEQCDIFAKAIAASVKE
ncbi:FprA family A-type flavoprotein [Alistipes sp. OttesenSCG-928-B03]|nr:FprA family A-type flavoprotein [Alistipes sp. OttesenSCG-928-B03]